MEWDPEVSNVKNILYNTENEKYNIIKKSLQKPNFFYQIKNENLKMKLSDKIFVLDRQIK